MACMAATLVIGTTMGLAGVHRTDRDAHAATAVATDEPAFVKAPAPVGDFAPLAVHGQDFCKSVAAQDPVASFLNPGCSAPKPRHGKRAAAARRPSF